ncbi:sarcosine oxidase subunit delta (plasmid) [Aliisedimentitalea scapharcae]|uniref:Sarcosine oxidase subunit delta n=1 Tax=Aliisedimentitalea scapharcae TaxID=1524259 RepID=A0ABZ2XYV4_9RHOB
MLLIPCPNCGPRDEGEFSYGGPARALPALEADVNTGHNALYHGVNPRGPLRELWYHTSGCECWITLTRDTATHDFVTGDI